MKLSDFIKEFAETHQLKHIDDIGEGIIQESITEDIYLVKNAGVNE